MGLRGETQLLDVARVHKPGDQQAVRRRTRTLADLEFALYELRAEGGDALGGDGLALGLVLGHLVLQGYQADGGTLLFLQAEELQDALVVLHVAVDEDEEDLEKGEASAE